MSAEEVTRYRTKSAEVEAWRVQVHNLAEVAAWCGGLPYTEDAKWDYGAGAVVLPDGSYAHVSYRKWGVIVPTHEGYRLASFGDWVIKSAAGKFGQCDSELFEQRYEPAEAPRPTPGPSAAGVAGGTGAGAGTDAVNFILSLSDGAVLGDFRDVLMALLLVGGVTP